jgi:hypothetical protein
MEDYENKSNIVWLIFLILLTTVLIIPSVGIQSKDILEGATFGMPNTSVLKNYFKLFVVFPICYYVFIRQIRKLKNNFIKGSLFLAQGLGILFFAFYIVDNSHPGPDTEASLNSIYKSDTFNFVYIIPIIDVIVATVYFIRVRKRIASFFN